MGTATDVLGMKLIHEEDAITITQNIYNEGLISKLGLEECRASIVPCDPNVDLSTACDEEAVGEFEYRSIDVLCTWRHTQDRTSFLSPVCWHVMWRIRRRNTITQSSNW